MSDYNNQTTSLHDLPPQSAEGGEMVTHYTDLDGFNNIQHSAKLLATTEGRVYFSKKGRSWSIPRENKYRISVTGPLKIHRHPIFFCHCLPSFWGILKFNQWVTPTGYDIKLTNINVEDDGESLTATGSLIPTPKTRRYLGTARRFYRYIFFDVIEIYGFLLLTIISFLSSFSCDVFVILFKFWFYTVVVLNLVAGLWYLSQKKIIRYLIHRENLPIASIPC